MICVISALFDLAKSEKEINDIQHKAERLLWALSCKNNALKGDIDMKKSYILGSFIVCFLALLCSCTHVTDDTEHTSDFYVFNMTGEVLDVEFVSHDKKSVFQKCSIKNIQPAEENDEILNMDYDDFSKSQVSEKIAHVTSIFIPGTYTVDIDCNAQSERIYPVFYKNGKKIKAKNGNAYMTLRYNKNPNSYFTIIKSKIKQKINPEDYKTLIENNNELYHALNDIYYPHVSFGNYSSEPSEIKVDLYSFYSPKKYIDTIRLIEQYPALVDDDYSYILFCSEGYENRGTYTW